MAAPDDTLDLLQRWHRGDREALATLVERDRPWVEGHVRQRRGAALQRHEETADEFQELMLRVLRYTPRFLCANRAQLRGLLSRMIENLLIDRARRLASRRHEVLLGQASHSQLGLVPGMSPATDPADAAARGEDVAWMRLGLEFLGSKDRDIVWQRQFAEASFVEIAAALGATEDSVRMRFQRALLRLAAIVQRLRAGELDQLLAEQVE
jgi:RNA polymerase sigma factor (sigma-70 family)